MDQIKLGSTNNLTCDVCKIDFNSNADYALHEFSKKHCDNLIRLAKQRPVVSKKTKSESSQVQKELPKVNTVTRTGSFAKYGYFIPGKIYASAETSKEFNTDYDPYLQKFAENPFKEKSPVSTSIESANFSLTSGFNKKKKKKIKTCQVCNITLSTIPEYEAHMKSPQHIWKLKVTGMGVSAHFVKASTDLHTTDIKEESKFIIQTKNDKIPANSTNNENQVSGSFPLLYCSDCDLLLNSPQQYNAHINGKFHLECAQKKAELKAKKEKFENPSPNQLYCYSCKISLNNLFQYNEHRNGKKHKTKCKNLIRKGITIPPEERVPGMPLPNAEKPVIYPELYEKLVLEKKKLESESGHFMVKKDLNTSSDFLASLSYSVENHLDRQESSSYSKFEKIKMVCCLKSPNETGNWNEIDPALATVEKCSDLSKTPQIIFHNNCTKLLVDTPVLKDSNPEINNSQVGILNCQKISPDDGMRSSKKETKNQITIIIDNKPVKCSICSENFQWQSQLDAHLGTETHFKKILELKMNRSSTESEILNTIFADRNIIKPNNIGKLTCSVCNVAADNKAEFESHLKSIVHKYTLKDYKIKRTIEVKHMVACNEQGFYFCKLCKEGWPSLLDYTQHLHFVKHKSFQRTQRAKAVLAKRTYNLQKQRLTQCLKKKSSLLRRIKTEKNPGVRTKVCGVAVDLQSGAQAPIPNLEPLEPKIDLTKNVSIGVYEKANDNLNSVNNNDDDYDDDDDDDGNDDDNDGDNDGTKKVTKLKKRCRIVRPNRKLQNFTPVQVNNNFYPPFRPSGNLIPPLLPGPPFQSRFSRPAYAPFNRNWVPYSSPYSSVFEPYCNRPSTGNSYVRPPWFQRPSWPRFR